MVHIPVIWRGNSKVNFTQILRGFQGELSTSLWATAAGSWKCSLCLFFPLHPSPSCHPFPNELYPPLSSVCTAIQTVCIYIQALSVHWHRDCLYWYIGSAFERTKTKSTIYPHRHNVSKQAFLLPLWLSCSLRERYVLLGQSLTQWSISKHLVCLRCRLLDKIDDYLFKLKNYHEW